MAGQVARRSALFAVAAVLACLAAASTPVNEVTFINVTKTAGIPFVHQNAASAEKFLIETMGSGAGWIDYNNDGWLDLYLVNSAGSNRLYRNRGDGTFIDVTEKARVDGHGVFGMGLAVGDFNNDGRQDLFVTGYGQSILYRNIGDGTFSDVTEQAGVANRGKWGSSAAWFDYNNDGLLDLIIANYVDWTAENNIYCGESRPGYRSYCHPNKYHGQSPTLYHNNGDGTFADVSATSGIAQHRGNGLGVVCFDYDGDGWQDVFIANDSMANFLFRNHGGKRFQDVAVETGVAYGEDGKAEAGMGVDAADYDNDGRPDIFVTHLDREFNRLYRNTGKGSFDDATFGSKLGYHNFNLSGFGTRFMDYDNDGWRDLFIANGHVLDNINLFHRDTTHAEKKTMHRNVNGTFVPVSEKLGKDLLRPSVSRAAAIADYDNDGDLDIVVSNNGGPPELLRNDGGNASHWIQIKLVGTQSNHDGFGAKVRIVAGGRTQIDELKGGASYQSANDPRLHFGLGNGTQVDLVEVMWPSGSVDRQEKLKADQAVTIREKPTN